MVITRQVRWGESQWKCRFSGTGSFGVSRSPFQDFVIQEELTIDLEKRDVE
jgi:hypothetical protein